MVHIRLRVTTVVGDRLISPNTSLAKYIPYSMIEGRKISCEIVFTAAAERYGIAPRQWIQLGFGDGLIKVKDI